MPGEAGVLGDLLAMPGETAAIAGEYRRPKYLCMVSYGIAVSYVH